MRVTLGGARLRVTEQALHDSEERLRLALVAAKQGMYDLNLETGAVMVSPEYASMLGHDPLTLALSGGED